MERPHLTEEGGGAALPLGESVEPNHVATERAEPRPRHDRDRPLRNHEEVTPAHPPQRDAQLLKIDVPSVHRGGPFGAWIGPLPGHTKCVA